MTDQIPADKVEKIADAMRVAMRRDENTYSYAEFLDDMSGYIRDLEALLPAPKRPTLADMTREERRECQWMQCEVNGEIRVITLIREGNDHAVTLAPSGFTFHCPPEKVTPHPDLPRMEWPGTEKPAPAPALPDGFRLAEHPDYGRVIVTTPDPGCDGDVYFVYPETVLSLGFNSGWCDPDELTYIDGPTTKGAGTTTGPNDVAVGTVIESADDPRIAALPVGSILLGRNEEATTKRHWGWSGAGFSPIVYERDRFAPWTVLHIPKEADQ